MRYLTAERIFSGQSFLAENSALVLDDAGSLEAIVSSGELPAAEIERYQGILCPGFVNAHCHLELSHLLGSIPMQTGLPLFAREVVKQRQAFSEEQVQQAIVQADAAMWQNGVVAVGDISNTTQSFRVKQQSRLYYHTFVELIGLKPQNAQDIFARGKELLKALHQHNLRGSLAPHAPYSCSVELIQQIAEFDAGAALPFSIHNQESMHEDAFFKGKPSGFNDLYAFLNLDVSWFRAPGSSSLAHYAKALPASRALLVHNTFTQPADIAALTSDPVWCFCPNANLYIENQLPDFGVFAGHTFCIGTDSLASNQNLDIVAEINTLLKHQVPFGLEQLLRASTYTPSVALGLDDRFGQLLRGKNTGLNLLSFNDSTLKLIKKIQ